MQIGYIRCSQATAENRNAATQRMRLEEHGVDRIYEDVQASGATFDRTGWRQTLEVARAGDTIVVSHLDRIGRTVLEGLDAIKSLRDAGINIVAIAERVDTSDQSAMGQLTVNILLSLAQWHHDTTRERIRDGMERARADGRHPGRESPLKPRQIPEVERRLIAGDSISSIARWAGVSRTPVTTVRKRLERDGRI